MSFTNHLRQLAKSSWDAQLTHPFVVALGNGTLPERKFKYYILQDARFLGDLSRVYPVAKSSIASGCFLDAAMASTSCCADFSANPSMAWSGSGSSA